MTAFWKSAWRTSVVHARTTRDNKGVRPQRREASVRCDAMRAWMRMQVAHHIACMHVMLPCSVA